MTAEKLKIRQCEFDVLVKVLGMLERGELIHLPQPNLDAPADLPYFNMNLWNEPCRIAGNEACGTVACIGGWAQKIGGFEFCEESNGRLNHLFYPPTRHDGGYNNGGYNRITPEQAARALNNYLTTGCAEWPSILGYDNEWR